MISILSSIDCNSNHVVYAFIACYDNSSQNSDVNCHIMETFVNIQDNFKIS